MKVTPAQIITTPNTSPCIPNCPVVKEHDPADAMESLEEKIKKATKTWEGVDVERYLAEVRGVDVDLIDAAQSLVDAVERYVQQECLRSELMIKKDKLKAIVNEERK